MTILKQGDLITSNNGKARKVLGVCGDMVHISYSDKHNGYLTSYTETELKENGFTWDTPAWEPEMKGLYWYISSNGEVVWSNKQDTHHYNNQRDFLGIYKTEELAEAALLEIRRKLGK